MNAYPLSTRYFARWSGLALVAITAVLGLSSRASMAAEINDHSTLKHADRAFLDKVGRSSLDEVEVSRVAADRTSNPQVREFAQQMVTDHQALMDELGALAAQKGVALPAKDNLADRWSKKNAKSFDADYLKKMASDHENTVKAFEHEAKNGDDADVVAFARKYLPKLQAHLEHATDLKKALK